MAVIFGVIVVAVFIFIYFAAAVIRVAGFVALAMMAGAIYIMSILIGVLSGAVWFAGIAIFGQEAAFGVTSFALAFYAIMFVWCCRHTWFSIKGKVREYTTKPGF